MRDELRRTEESSLPEPVMRRLPRYLIDAQELKASGETWVSSVALAKALGLTSSTVRQDLSHLELEGVSKRGYEIEKLITAVTRKLGADKTYRVIIVGAGFLGSAIALHGDLARYGFEVAAVMDVDPKVIGTSVGGLQVQSMKALSRLVKQKHIDIGIIAVPAADAQGVAEQLTAAGITALLNLALVQLKVPEHVQVVEERIVVSLQELAYLMRTRAKEEKAMEGRNP
ncbi:MAG TPA: redox-sensing transcriptional repressor Rex [Polyangiales bacterium]|nr:redox-sensing transcriptional repressor Rex [Polyangiales bacterium]